VVSVAITVTPTEGDGHVTALFLPRSSSLLGATTLFGLRGAREQYSGGDKWAVDRLVQIDVAEGMKVKHRTGDRVQDSAVCNLVPFIYSVGWAWIASLFSNKVHELEQNCRPTTTGQQSPAPISNDPFNHF
jgi:hypothetical protein